MKSICIVLCMVLCFSLFTACSPQMPQNASSVSSDAEVPMPTLCPDEVYTSLPNDLMAWGLKKNKGEKPDIPDSVIKTLETFDGVYLSKNKNTLFLTFDEGYENGYTSQILDVLKKTNTPAAFFVTGDYIKTQPDLVRRMAQEGHIVGNHTKNHPSMPTVSSIKNLEAEIVGLDDMFFELTGKHMRYIRPPRGEFSERTLAVSKDLGYKSVFWSFAYADWEKDKTKGAQYAYEHVMPYLHDGAIILLHAVSKDNTEALEQIIVDARAKGYEFKSLDEL